MAIISGSITNSDDNIVADGANDIIDSLLGNDVVDGGRGNDNLQGGGGNDNLIGGGGDDLLQGGPGPSVFSPDDDFLSGGGGTDTVKDSGNVNFILTNTTLTGNGSDTLSGVEVVKLTGGIDNNILNASAFTAGSVTLNGGAGNDSLDGGSGNDTLNGGEENDFIDGNAGNDTLNGGDGSDKLTGGSGNDSFQGGGGAFTVDEIWEYGTNFTLTDASLVGNGTDTFSNIDNVRLGEGSLFTSNLTYDASAFTLGTVEFDGGSGDDIFNGGSGDDDLDSGDGNDTLNGGAGSDRLDGEEGSDILNGGAGSDDLDGNEGRDTLNGGAGGDYLSGDTANDTLNGGAGNDDLFGDEGNDTLDGFGAVAGVQVDELTGGTGADLFVLGAAGFGAYYLGNGEATITDFSAGAGDEIRLAGSSGDYNLTNSGGDAVLFQGVDTIGIVQNTSVLDVSSSLVFV